MDSPRNKGERVSSDDMSPRQDYYITYAGFDLENPLIIAEIFKEFINVSVPGKRFSNFQENKKHGFYKAAGTFKRLQTKYGSENEYDPIFATDFLGRQPLRSDVNPFGAEDVGQGETRHSAPKLFSKRHHESSPPVNQVLAAEALEKKGIVVAIYRQYEMRGSGDVVQPMEWAEKGVYHHWIPMDDNTVEKDLNYFEVADMLFMLIAFSERNLVLGENDFKVPIDSDEHKLICSLIQCKSGVGRSAKMELLYTCYKYLRNHKEVYEQLNAAYQKKYGQNLVVLMHQDGIEDAQKLKYLIDAAAVYIENKRPQVHLHERRRKFTLDVLTHMYPMILAGKDSMEFRPPNYRFVADLVQSIAFKHLMIDFGTLNMVYSQRSKDVKAFFQRLMHNQDNWYDELCHAANREQGQEKGFLTHYVNCQPKLQTAAQQEAGNRRRHRLVLALKATIEMLAEKYPTSLYAESVRLGQAHNRAAANSNKREVEPQEVPDDDGFGDEVSMRVFRSSADSADGFVILPGALPPGLEAEWESDEEEAPLQINGDREPTSSSSNSFGCGGGLL